MFTILLFEAGIVTQYEGQVLPHVVISTIHIDISAAILQRVISASVSVDKQLVSSIGKGILVFAAVAPGDTEKDADALAAKVLKMRLWDDEAGGRVWETLCLCTSNTFLILINSQWKHNVQDIKEKSYVVRDKGMKCNIN